MNRPRMNSSFFFRLNSNMRKTCHPTQESFKRRKCQRELNFKFATFKDVSLSRVKKFLRREIFLGKKPEKSFFYLSRIRLWKAWRTCQNCRIAIINRINTRLTYNKVFKCESWKVERWNLNERFIARNITIDNRVNFLINNNRYIIVDQEIMPNTKESTIDAHTNFESYCAGILINDQWIYLYGKKFTLELNKREW